MRSQLRGEEATAERTRWKYQRYMRYYLQTVQAIDDGVGRVLEELEELGVADDTLIVYTSDQEFFLGDHGWYDKRLMFRESLRMPVLARWPRHIPAGAISSDIATNVDLAATFLDVAGIDPDAAMPRQQGRSLLPALAQMRAELARLQEHYEDLPYDGPSTPRPAWEPALPQHGGCTCGSRRFGTGPSGPESVR